MSRSTPRTAPRLLAVLELLGALTRAFGGTALLAVLGAPTWAWLAWLMANVRFRLIRTSP